MNQKFIFITGKGGVGKSLVAAALAHSYSKKGRKTLLVELGYQSFYQNFLTSEGLLNARIGYKPIKTAFGFDVALWSGPECLKEYALHLLKSEMLYKLLFENKVSKSLIQIAPALSELALLGKITSGPRRVGPKLDYDVIVIDGFATGHMMALLKAPRGMAEAIQFGPMGEQTRSILKYIQDPKFSSYMIVGLPEELPLQESLELKKMIQDEVKLEPQIVINKKISKLKDETIPQAKEYLADQEKKQNAEIQKHLSGQDILQLPYVFDHKVQTQMDVLSTQMQSLVDVTGADK